MVTVGLKTIAAAGVKVPAAAYQIGKASCLAGVKAPSARPDIAII